MILIGNDSDRNCSIMQSVLAKVNTDIYLDANHRPNILNNYPLYFMPEALITADPQRKASGLSKLILQ
jgi:hypothetical protein